MNTMIEGLQKCEQMAAALEHDFNDADLAGTPLDMTSFGIKLNDLRDELLVLMRSQGSNAVRCDLSGKA